MFSEPNRFTCGTCQQICSSAWSLIQHVQDKHGVKLCQETPAGQLSSEENQPAGQWKSSSNGSSGKVSGASGVPSSSPSPILGSTLMGASTSSSVSSTVTTSSPQIMGASATSTGSSRHHRHAEGRDRSVSRESSRERSSPNSSAAAAAAAAQLLAASGQQGGFSLANAAAAAAVAAAAASNGGRNPLVPPNPFSPEGLGLLRFPFPQPFCMPPRPPSATSTASTGASHDFRAVEQLVSPAAAASLANFSGAGTPTGIPQGMSSGNSTSNGGTVPR